MKSYGESVREIDEMHENDIFLEELEGAMAGGERGTVDLKIWTTHYGVLKKLFIRVASFNQGYYYPLYACLEREVEEKLSMLEKEIEKF